MRRGQQRRRLLPAAPNRIVVAGLLIAALAAGLTPGAPIDTAGVAGAQAAPPAGVADVRLRLLASHDLASPGHDGTVRARGNNGDLAVLRDTAYVGGGAVSNEARWSPGRICTDWGGVKVVDIADPTRPRLRTTITIVDDIGVEAGPVGNPRRGLRVDNVAVSAGAVDARTVATPSFSGDVLAVAVERCEAPFTNGGRVEFYDVDDPGSPRLLGTFRAGGAGVVEDVRMFTRANGRLSAVVTLPFNGTCACST